MGWYSYYNKGHLKELHRIILKHIFSHMKKTLESVSFDYRRGIEERVDQGGEVDQGGKVDAVVCIRSG